MDLLSWGMYPKINATVFKFDQKESLKQIVTQHNDIVAYGNGRSYGDSALNKNIIDVGLQNYFLNFNQNTGLLHLQAGVLLSDILECFVPKGWFLQVSPGTKFVTIGGAIASDIHGKNHHIAGCFSECIKEFEIMLTDGQIVNCSKEETPELFKATCGGMGLTGVILSAKIHLKKINSQHIHQTTVKTKNLKETFEIFEKYHNKPYSVAWIDCLAKDNKMGRCLLTLGEFSDDGDLHYHNKKQKNIAFNFPSFVLNSWSVRIFNWLYYHKVRQKISKRLVDINTFFYPLDGISNWNRIYGKNGLIQYQLILPKQQSYQGLKEILSSISKSRKGSFLAVLKLHGKANDNYLSFPIEGYSLALDFKIQRGLFALLDKLDKIVLKYKGRIYLTKDARVSKAVFEAGYPKVDIFRQYRSDQKMDVKFQSLQSKRLGI